nr:MAG TPA: hypothetical protein [Caudoviricetes sp.]
MSLFALDKDKKYDIIKDVETPRRLPHTNQVQMIEIKSQILVSLSVAADGLLSLYINYYFLCDSNRKA